MSGWSSNAHFEYIKPLNISIDKKEKHVVGFDIGIHS